MNGVYLWASRNQLLKEERDLDDAYCKAYDIAETKEDRSKIHAAYVQKKQKVHESLRIHALSRKHYVFRIIIEEDLAGWDSNKIPSSRDVARWNRAVRGITEKLAEKFPNWLPPENKWDQHFRTNGGNTNTYNGLFIRINLDCLFHRIEYLDPDILFDHIFQIYLTVSNYIKKINEEEHQEFSIIIRDRKDNEWFAMEDWPKEEGHWKTIWKQSPHTAAGNRARTDGFKELIF